MAQRAMIAPISITAKPSTSTAAPAEKTFAGRGRGTLAQTPMAHQRLAARPKITTITPITAPMAGSRPTEPQRRRKAASIRGRSPTGLKPRVNDVNIPKSAAFSTAITVRDATSAPRRPRPMRPSPMTGSASSKNTHSNDNTDSAAHVIAAG